MSKITRKVLNERLLLVETLLGLHRTLPEQISNEQANNAIFRMQCALSSGKDLAKRQAQLKQLDQSIFDDEPPHLRWAAIEEDGSVYLFAKKPFVDLHKWAAGMDEVEVYVGNEYDSSEWQDSLIERKADLTGSDLCRAMLAKGDSRVVCLVSNISDSQAVDCREHTMLIEGFSTRDGFWDSRGTDYSHAVPVSAATNEPLIAKEVGL